MGLNPAAYTEMLRGLLPPGIIWTCEPGSALHSLLEGMAMEFWRADLRAEDLRRESDPRTTAELLADFERVLGLPEADAPEDQTYEQRALEVVAKLVSLGGQTRAYFLAVAASRGFDIGINTFDPCTCESECEAYLCDDDWQFVWEVTGAGLNVRTFRTGSGRCGEPLRTWGDNALARIFGRIKPSRTAVIFTDED